MLLELAVNYWSAEVYVTENDILYDRVLPLRHIFRKNLQFCCKFFAKKNISVSLRLNVIKRFLLLADGAGIS